MFRPHRFLCSSLRQCLVHTFGTNASTSRNGESLRHNMGDSVTWDNIYTSKSSSGFSHFDWFCGYEDLKSFLLSLIHEMAPEKYTGPPLHVLDVGCGTSDVGLGLFQDSHIPLLITCIDRSTPAVLSMQNSLIKGDPAAPKHHESRLEYVEGDVTDLYDIPSGSVSLVLDKGTTDALLRSGREAAGLLLQEALRVLQAGGKLVQLTDEDPDARLPFLEGVGAGPTVTFHDLGDKKGIAYYAYIVTRSS
ncbi:citrate synthase-lysine N-methyltransferase CSKMT, mitochondrial [Mixophyes fleayi]|uniref:citrate synthase-lysine N-methyltransferase CSKMT, mitochondrial n=1 Tax=Mixophyes fleayi TaxID=3061075 RepID=UPI003F4DF55A